MKTRITRADALARFQAEIDAGRPLVGAGAGTGISAKFSERGGVDIIIIYNSGRYRMAGRGSLAGVAPYGDANAIVMEMAQEVLPVVEDAPVPSRGLRNRSLPPNGSLSQASKRYWLHRHPELPHCRS